MSVRTVSERDLVGSLQALSHDIDVEVYPLTQLSRGINAVDEAQASGIMQLALVEDAIRLTFRNQGHPYDFSAHPRLWLVAPVMGPVGNEMEASSCQRLLEWATSPEWRTLADDQTTQDVTASDLQCLALAATLAFLTRHNVMLIVPDEPKWRDLVAFVTRKGLVPARLVFRDAQHKRDLAQIMPMKFDDRGNLPSSGNATLPRPAQGVLVDTNVVLEGTSAVSASDAIARGQEGRAYLAVAVLSEVAKVQIAYSSFNYTRRENVRRRWLYTTKALLNALLQRHLHTKEAGGSNIYLDRRWSLPPELAEADMVVMAYAARQVAASESPSALSILTKDVDFHTALGKLEHPALLYTDIPGA